MRIRATKWVSVGIAPVAFAIVSITIGCTTGVDSQNGSCAISTTNANASQMRGIRDGGVPDLCSYGSVVRLDITAAGGQAVCSGTLIATNVVLSAAHCFVDPDIAPVHQLTIRATGISATANGVAYRIFPGYNQSSLNSPDMSIIYLDRPMPINPPVIATGMIKLRTEIVALGYGRDARGADGNGNLGTLEMGTLTVKDPGGTNRNLTTVQTNASQQDTCSGDSGGPAFFNRQIVGVLSGGDYSGGVDNCRNSSDSIYTPVVYYRSWIAQQVGLGTNGATPIQ